MNTWCNGKAADTYFMVILRKGKHHEKLTFRQAVDEPRIFQCLYTRTTNGFSSRPLTIILKIRFNIISPTEEFLSEHDFVRIFICTMRKPYPTHTAWFVNRNNAECTVVQAVLLHSVQLYRVIKKSVCTWWLQYRKLQVMFKESPASLQTFIDRARGPLDSH
jgi:hypothetical protein